MSMSTANLSRHGHQATAHRRNEGGPVWLSAAAGLCASLVGLGLARFAYTPLIPALIAAKWFSPADAVYLGAANLAGYLAGRFPDTRCAIPACRGQARSIQTIRTACNRLHRAVMPDRAADRAREQGQSWRST
jgi:Uncharacterised MFS-type transporter YbfB